LIAVDLGQSSRVSNSVPLCRNFSRIMRVAVDKLITVHHAAGSAIQPDAVRHKIEDALRRSADVEASQIELTVEGGKVTLNGHVRSWFGRGLVRNAAWAAPGVTEVTDPDAVKRLAAAGTPAILVRPDTVASDIEGMALAAGILAHQHFFVGQFVRDRCEVGHGVRHQHISSVAAADRLESVSRTGAVPACTDAQARGTVAARGDCTGDGALPLTKTLYGPAKALDDADRFVSDS
jgi:hypothetical protein